MEDRLNRFLESVNLFQSTHYRGLEYMQDQESMLYMKSCGIENCMPDYSYPIHKREGYHLHVIFTGCGTLWIQDRQVTAHAGQMFLIKDNEEIRYQADHVNPWHYCWITFCGAKAKTYMEYAGFTDDVYVRDCKVDATEFLSVVKEIVAHPYLNLSSEVCRMSYAYRYLSLAIESFEKDGQFEHRRTVLTAEDYVNYAVNYIRNNYATIRIGDVAKYIGISRTYFTEIFKKKMLVSPQEFLMQVRMNRSTELLIHTDLSIRDIGREVGYDDQLTFSKIFKKKFGLSPEQYRKVNTGEMIAG